MHLMHPCDLLLQQLRVSVFSGLSLRLCFAVRHIASLPVALYVCVYCGISCSTWTTNNHLISPYNLHIFFAQLTLSHTCYILTLTPTDL